MSWGMRLSRLTLRGMFEAAIGNGAEKFWLQEEIPESSRVNADIAAFLIDTVAGTSKITFLGTRGGSGGLVGVELVVGVVDEFVLGRHLGRWSRWRRVRSGVDGREDEAKS